MGYEPLFELISKLPYYSTITYYIDETFVRIFVFTISLFIYAVISWKFYSTLAKRDLFKVKLTPWMSKWEKFSEILSFLLKYTFIFPLYSFFWFILFSLFLILLSKSITLGEIFFFSIVMISLTRLTAYYNEELARTIGEVIPTTLLVVFLTEPSFFSPEIITQRWEEFLSSFPGIFSYLIFAICWEWFLRILYYIKIKISDSKDYGEL